MIRGVNVNILKILFGNVALVIYITTVFLVGRENVSYYPLLFVSALVSSYWIQYAIYLITKSYFSNSKSLLTSSSFDQGNRIFRVLSNWGIYLYEQTANNEKTIKLAFKENIRSMLVISVIVGVMCLFSPIFIYVLLIIPTLPILFILKQYEIDGRLKP